VDAVWVEERLRLGEDSRTEFKGVAAAGFDIDAGDLAREIAAFANSGGGYILLGVENDGRLTGAGSIEQADKLMQKAVNVCRDRNLPQCTFSKVLVRDNLVLVLEVPGSTPDRPYLVGGRFLVRQGSETREGSRAELLQVTQSVDYHFDEQAVSGTTRKEIDEDAVRRFLANVYGRIPEADETTRYLRALGCLTEEDTPTVAGILFFGRDLQRWLPDARVSAVRFPGIETTSEFLDRQEIGGRLPDQFSATIDFLSKHLTAPSRVEGWQRVEAGIMPDVRIPLQVLREAVLNALGHRDYRMASQTRLFVYDDRVEIVNPGGLLNRLTLESIRLGSSQRRNPRIALLLARALTARQENIGIGIPDMCRLMRERGLPEPSFSVEGGHFRVVIRGR
jgi:ATP-dependent DNA helicase RecG